MAYCIENSLDLESVNLEKYQEFSPLFEADLYEEISLQTCVNKRISQGGTGRESVQSQIAYYKKSEV